MYIKKITIHNIASIEDAVIDFTEEPLASADVFLIAGKTGSGKSTILDAISLALYATTPRLEGLEEKNTKIADGDIDITARDPRQLMRRGTGECSATLLFDGNDGTTYEAIWSVVRAGKKASGRLQTKRWFLRNLKTGTLWDKDTEIESEIRKSTGLAFDQFCRTTMLAQGDFLSFLNSKDDKKSEILEKITGTSIYAEIGKRIFENTSKKENEYKSALKVIEGVTFMSDEEVENKRHRIEELTKLKAELETNSKELQTKLQWVSAYNKLLQQTNETERLLKESREVTETDDFRKRKILVKEWNDTIDARQQLKQFNTAIDNLKKLEMSREQLNNRYDKAVGALLWQQEQLQLTLNELSKVDILLTPMSARKNILDQYQLILSYLNSITDCELKITKKEHETLSLKSLHDGELTQILVDAESKLKNEEDILSGKQRELSAKENILQLLDMPTVRKEQKANNETLGLITLAKAHLTSYLEEKSRLDAERDALATMKKNIDQRVAKLPSIKIDAEKLKVIREERKSTLDNMSDSMNDWAKMARSKLKKGDLCPVCRQTISEELHIDKDLQILLDHAREQFNKAEEDYRNKQKELDTLNTELDTLEKEYKRRNEAMNGNKALTDKAETLKEDMQRLGITELSVNNIGERLSAIETQAETSKQQIDIKIESGENLEKTIAELRKQKDCATQKRDLAKASVDKASGEKEKCQNDIDKAKALIAQLIENKKQAEQAVATIIDDTTWNNDWRVARSEFGKELENAATEFNYNTKLQNELKQSVDRLNSEIDNIKQCLTSPPFSDDKLQSAIHSATPKPQKPDNVNELLATAAAVEGSIKEAGNQKAATLAWLQDFHAKHPEVSSLHLNELSQYSLEHIGALKSEIDKCEKTVTQYEAVLNEHHKHQKELDSKRPKLDDNDMEGLLQSRIEDNTKLLADYATELGSLNSELKADDENRNRQALLKKEAEEKRQLFQRWKALCDIFGDKNGKTFRTIAQSYVLSNLIHSANYYMRQLSDRYELKVEPGSFVIQVLDAYQGYTSRSAGTISGGEGFLVSLALALALSDIGKGLSANILFIDEGFGTLSGEPLQNAVQTLKSLHSHTGRHVGIISHIEELQERIPVQIQVRQEGHNSYSTVQICGM